MPRGPRANRSDLLVAKPPLGATPPGTGQPNGQPVQVPTGLPYGENQALAQAQSAVPLPAGGGAPAPGGGGPGSPLPGAPAGGSPDVMAAALPAAQAMAMPNLGDLERPTERPSEPVTAGLPGHPAPAGFTPPPSLQGGGVSALLGQIANAQGSSALAQLAQRAQALGQ